MSDPEESKQTELERLLIHSARLDVPKGSAKDRVLEAGLAELRSRAPVRSRIRAGVVGGAGVLLAAAALALYFRRSPAPPPALVAEAPVSKNVSPVAPGPPPACPEIVIARGDSVLIEDWENSDLRLLGNDGREGKWAAFDDGTQKQTPVASPLVPRLIPGRRGESRRALFMSGGKFENWGFVLNSDLAEGACYDVSAYAGVKLWARGKGRMQVGLQMIDIQARKFGGFCDKDCYNTHRKTVDLGSGWRQYGVRWEELRQLWSKGKIEFDPKRVRLIEFAFFAEDSPFEVWLDDIEFIPRQRQVEPPEPPLQND